MLQIITLAVMSSIVRYVLISIGILSVVFTLAYVYYWNTSSQGDGRGGFLDYLKNPSYRQEAAEYFAVRDALEVADDISDEEIQKMVDKLGSDDDEFNLDRLKLVGEKAFPMLIKVLENRSLASQRISDGDEEVDEFSESIFERVVDLLHPYGLSEATEALSAYVDHEEDHFRKYAAYALGNIGSDECVDPILKALADQDDYVRSYAIMGMQFGIKDKRCTPNFLKAVVPKLLELLDKQSIAGGTDLPDLLLAIDQKQAVKFFLSDKYFSIENENLLDILRVLNESEIAIPRDKLFKLMKIIKPLAVKYSYEDQYAEALLAYANNPDDNAEQLFRKELSSAYPDIQQAAAEGLGILLGVKNASHYVFDIEEKKGFEGLSLPQKYYYAVTIYDGQVNNGGHSQYYVNTYGTAWRFAYDGLKAIGTKERVEIIIQSAKLFGKGGPSDDGNELHEQIASFTRKQDQALSELDDRYYDCKESIETLLAQYVLKHPEHFTNSPLKKRR